MGRPDTPSCRALRSARIALSSYGKEDDVERSRAAGVARHITKPVTIETLRSGIEQLGVAAARRQGPIPVS
jgi:CheY-like chemotaxis protein